MGGESSKSECKTNHPELIETQAECKTSHPELIEQSECQCDGGAGIPDCPANFVIRDDNCNQDATQANCETGGTQVAGQNIAYKCKWNSAAARGGVAACDPWKKIDPANPDPANPIEYCRIPQ